MALRRQCRWPLGIVGAVILVAGGLGAKAGLFGGPVFTEMHANATVPRARLSAVFLSGDIGFNFGMGPHIARRITDDGIPVVGVNTLTYFRQRRSVGEIKQLVAVAIRKALALGPADQVILIGQSYGADILQAGLAGLAEPLRQKIAMVALIVPTDAIHYRISPGEMLGWTPPDADALVTARQLDWVPTICIYGRTETDSPCPSLTWSNVHSVALPGGHGLHQDSAAVHAVLFGAVAQITELSLGAQRRVSHEQVAASPTKDGK